jgi:hypothetical protein
MVKSKLLLLLASAWRKKQRWSAPYFPFIPQHFEKSCEHMWSKSNLLQSNPILCWWNMCKSFWYHNHSSGFKISNMCCWSQKDIHFLPVKYAKWSFVKHLIPFVSHSNPMSCSSNPHIRLVMVEENIICSCEVSPKKLLCSAEIHKNHQKLQLKFHVNSTKTIPSNSRFSWNSAKFSKNPWIFRWNHPKITKKQCFSRWNPSNIQFFLLSPPTSVAGGGLGGAGGASRAEGSAGALRAEPLCKSWPTLSSMEVSEDFLKKFKGFTWINYIYLCKLQIFH